MHTVIVVTQPGRTPLRVLLDDTLDIGRECDGLLVADERVSRRHVRLKPSGGSVVATDLGSSNGTLVNGSPISTPVTIAPGESLMIGDTSITVSSAAASTSTSPAPRGATVIRSVPADEQRRTSIESVAAEVAGDESGLLQRAVGDDQTVTIMFSDIESSTEHAIAVGDVEWMRVLRQHNSIFERRVSEHGGRIVKNQGDGYMITFDSARRALLCAAAIQRDLVDPDTDGSPSPIRVRMGCHTGEAIRDAGDLFGRHVIIAARVAGLAEGGQVLVSSIVREITSARADLVFDEPEQVELKGVDGVHDVFGFDWRSAPT